MRIAVMGTGSWGTAYAMVLADAGNEVVMWGRDAELCEAITTTHESVIVSMGFVSKLWFDKLPPDLQKIIVEEGRALEPEMQAWDNDYKASLYGEWQKMGGELISLSPQDKAELVRRTSGIGAEVVKDTPAVKEFYDLMIATASKTRQ